MNIYDFKAISAKGEEIPLSQFKNKVMLIINSATQCGFTPQYDALQNIYKRYADQDFIILDFPCNQFKQQAPGSSEEIAAFCETKFGVTFPIFSKIDVNGENADPLFKFLKGKKGFAGFDEAHTLTPVLKGMLEKSNPDYANEPDIKWNFTKFLIDRNGDVVSRFEPTADMNFVEEKIKELL